ncbi:MAG: hypothetical protein AB1592_18925 [Pseudomonadota bacterium]
MILSERAMLMAAAGLGLALIAARMVGARGLGAAVGSIVPAAVTAADAAIGEAVQGTAEVFGVPRTDQGKCDAAKRRGDAWDVSLYCPAQDFMGWVWDGRPQNGASGSW